MAEQIESIDELQSELERLRNPDEEEQKFIAFIGIPLEDRIAEAETRIRWRLARSSPAKCLSCGNADLVFLPDSDEFEHPITGERVLIVSRGFADSAPWHADFTPEGNLIRNEDNRT